MPASVSSTAFLPGRTVRVFTRDTLPGREPNARTGKSLGSARVNEFGSVTIGDLDLDGDYVLTDGVTTVRVPARESASERLPERDEQEGRAPAENDVAAGDERDEQDERAPDA